MSLYRIGVGLLLVFSLTACGGSSSTSTSSSSQTQQEVGADSTAEETTLPAEDPPTDDSAAEPEDNTADVVTPQPVSAVVRSGEVVTAGLVALPAGEANFALLQAPEHGQVEVDGATFTYWPASGFVGEDNFIYGVDGQPGVAAVTVEVLDASLPVAPGLASTCAEIGGVLSPLCGLLEQVTAPLIQTCSGNLPGEFCTLFGGNLYSLVEGCLTTVDNQAALFCRGVGVALELVASECRLLLLPDNLCGLVGGKAIGGAAVARYRQGPVHHTLSQQWRLAQHTPLGSLLVPSSHNSFNDTNATFPPSLTGLDPDQFYGLSEQLDLDMRALELDVHWIFSPAKAAMVTALCHGLDNHIGCTNERTLAAGLKEIRVWLDAHPDEFIILDVEQHLNDDVDNVEQSFASAAAVIESVLGNQSTKDIIWRPGGPDVAGECLDHPIPLALTPAAAIAEGKQVLIYSSGCGHDTGWDAIVHEQGNRLQGPSQDFADSHYPDCHFSRDDYQRYWTRFYDSSTFIDALSGAGTINPIRPSQIREMVRCGVNMPSINFLDPHSEQLPAFIWSWEIGQPLEAEAQTCAVHNGKGRLQAERCQQLLTFACRVGEDWRLTHAVGTYDQGEARCAEAFADGHFAAPINGYDNARLQAVKGESNTRIWVAVHLRGDEWQLGQ